MELQQLKKRYESNGRMPAIFLGHGSPMNAIENNEFSNAWSLLGEALPKPKLILCISAHWETKGIHVTAMENPRTIYDFYGFPQALYNMKYPAKGNPGFINYLQEKLPEYVFNADLAWGLDHGAWAVLSSLFPAADIPVVQLSLSRDLSMEQHYNLGKSLALLRDEDILIVGSGNIVHNLGMMQNVQEGFPWAVEFDMYVANLLKSGSEARLVNYLDAGKAASVSVPTSEHFLPLLYVAGARNPEDELFFINEGYVYGSLSMRSVIYT
ncbi:MAG: 4,5-DOPA dioxygenase extradiol [Ignavibacteria bacterium]|nr:4,5-DOPA dioxygenase extradiol [Ignavibacteria bacterium]